MNLNTQDKIQCLKSWRKGLCEIISPDKRSDTLVDIKCNDREFTNYEFSDENIKICLDNSIKLLDNYPRNTEDKDYEFWVNAFRMYAELLMTVPEDTRLRYAYLIYDID